jgi:amidohydrolase
MVLEKIIEHRRHLHLHPELSGKESMTSIYIEKFMNDNCANARVHKLSENGLLVIFKGKNKGKEILFRAELDALPISETNDFSYKSKKKGVSHKCGHDGHMAILLAVAVHLQEKPLKTGRISLLFQPAEETGQGASIILKDKIFKNNCSPDVVFALHNIPGYPLHSIVTKKNSFNSSVISVKVKLIGKTSHAAEPEMGINPSLAISEIIRKADALEVVDQALPNFSLITPIFITLGTESFGVSAGSGELGFTLRTWSNIGMRNLKEHFLEIILAVVSTHKLTYEVQWLEEFKSIENDEESVKIIQKAANECKLPFFLKKQPFKWGEDFGLFTGSYKGAMFGIGAGVDSPALHNPDYDFPDELIQSGSKMFIQIIKTIQDE